MALLTSRQRRKLPDSAFALPGRRYPIHDAPHARNALSRVSEYGTPGEITRVRAAVHRKFPHIGHASHASTGVERALEAA